MDGDAHQGVHMRVLYLQVSARPVIGLHVGERIMGVASIWTAQTGSRRGVATVCVRKVRIEDQ